MHDLYRQSGAAHGWAVLSVVCFIPFQHFRIEVDTEHLAKKKDSSPSGGCGVFWMKVSSFVIFTAVTLQYEIVNGLSSCCFHPTMAVKFDSVNRAVGPI